MWVADSVAANAGTERQMIEIGRRMDRSRFEMHLATFEANQPPIASQAFQLSVFPFVSAWSPEGMRQIFRMASLIRTKRIDIVHSFMLMRSAIASTVAAKLGGARVILTSRRDVGYHYTPSSLAMMRALNPLTTRITANCEAAKQAAVDRERANPLKIDVLYNGVDIAAITSAARGEEPTVPVPRDAKVVGIVANYRPVKDLHLFLRSAAIVAKQDQEAVFLLVGSGSLENELKDAARSLGIFERTIFTCGRGTVPPYLRSMSVACLTSVSEGLSNAILEYMAAGLPVVATDSGGNRELIEDSRTGFLVRDRTPETFASGVLRLLSDAERRRRFGAAGLQRCREKFDIAVAVRTTEQYYEEVLHGPNL